MTGTPSETLKDALCCPACGGGSAVYRRDGATGYRYRRCQVCDHAFVTQEVILTEYTVTRYSRRRPTFAPPHSGAAHRFSKTEQGHPAPARMALSPVPRP